MSSSLKTILHALSSMLLVLKNLFLVIRMLMHALPDMQFAFDKVGILNFEKVVDGSLLDDIKEIGLMDGI